MATDVLVARITDFLTSIALRVRFAPIDVETFLPGVHVDAGEIVIDEAKLLYPGDLLHQGGHLAMLTPSRRAGASGHMGDDGGFEMAAIGWSYAAAVHLEIPADVVFHKGGYKGGAKALIDNFTQGHEIGVPMLEWAGLSLGAKSARAAGVAGYPAMIAWVREQEP